MQQTKAIELWVGLFVGLGIIALFFLAMKVSNLADLKTDEKSYVITARFENVGSLKPRALVSMAGVRIGRVSAVTFDKDSYEAVVEMRIDPQFDTLPDDTTASILTQGLLGEQYIGLSAGGSPDYLKNGDEIDLTQSALVLEEVISRFLFSKAEGGADKKSGENQDTVGEADEEIKSSAEEPAREEKAVDESQNSPAPEPASVTEPEPALAPTPASTAVPVKAAPPIPAPAKVRETAPVKTPIKTWEKAPEKVSPRSK